MTRTRAFLLLLAVLASGSCRREDRLVVGMVPKGANHLFWQTVHAGAIKAAREAGLELEWNAPTVEIDTSRQIAILDSMVNRRLAGIAVAPVDRKALVNVVERAAGAGVPVVIFDSDIDTQQRIAYVATHNVEAGRIAGRRMGEILGGKGKVAVVSFMPGSASTMEREQGFLEVIREFPGIHVTGVLYGMSDRARSMAVTENVLSAHPDLDGIYANNESSSAGAAQALKARNNRRVKLVAMDSSDQLIEDLKAGWIDSLVLQDPFLMGYESVKALALHLNGGRPAAYLDSGVSLVRREDLETPQARALLYPDISRYLKGR